MSSSFGQICFLALIYCVSGVAGASSPAKIPMEPASDEKEVLDGLSLEPEPIEDDVKEEVEEKEMPRPRPSRKRIDQDEEPMRTVPERRPRREEVRTESQDAPVPRLERRAPSRALEGAEPGAGDFSAQLRFSMAQTGFGGHLKLVQFAKSWLGITETIRYFNNDDEDRDERAWLERRSFLVGLELHPYRALLVSPFLNLNVGWESFRRPNGESPERSILGEASAGAEIRMTRFASIVGQWTEAYYPDLKNQMFYPENPDKDPRRYARAEILFTLKWEKNIF